MIKKHPPPPTLPPPASELLLMEGRKRSYILIFNTLFTYRYYSATIIQMSGLQGDQLAIWLAAVVAFGNFAFTIVGVCLVEKMGRRKLLLGSLAGVTFSLFLLGGAFFMAKQHDASISLHEVVPLNVSDNCPRQDKTRQDDLFNSAQFYMTWVEFT